MGACEPFLSPFAPSNLVFPLMFDLIVYETSSPSIRVSLSPSFMDVEFPSDEAILEDMIMDILPLPKLKTSQVGYQRNPWPELSNGIYLEKHYA